MISEVTLLLGLKQRVSDCDHRQHQPDPETRNGCMAWESALMKSTLVQLTCRLQLIADPFVLIEALAKDKNVLNVGAAGGVMGYLPENRDIWLHERLLQVAQGVVGLDIDDEAIKYAAEHGVEIRNENCETMQLGEKFDLIVMSDVIEHVNAPVNAIGNLLRHLSPGGVLVVTTPNATAGNILLRALLRQPFNVLGDHVTLYYPEHFQAICDRVGGRIQSIGMFDHVDRRTMSTRIKSWMFRLMTRLSPRLSSSMLVVIGNE